jgi:hypothetical protein
VTYLTANPSEVIPFQLIPLIYTKKPELDDILLDLANASGTSARPDDYGLITGNTVGPAFRYREPAIFLAYFGVSQPPAVPWHKSMDPYKYTNAGTGPLIGSFNPAYGERVFDYLYTNHTPETR